MQTKGYVYLQMNQFYTATIRDTDSLKHYLDRANNGCKINFIDNTFGTIHSVSEDVSKGFLKEIQKIIKYQKWLKNSKMVGKYIRVKRNQAYRNGTIVGYNSDSLLLEYIMPNGTTALNVIKDIDVDEYKNITYQKAKQKFNIELDLINNPQ